MYEYEDKTEKQFQESDELDVGDWILHRTFVQNMSDIDRRTILDLPPVQPERKKGEWIYGEDEYGVDGYHCDECGYFVPWDYVHKFINYIEDYKFCPNCGADMRGNHDD
jgi:ribosomal protein S27AE